MKHINTLITILLLFFIFIGEIYIIRWAIDWVLRYEFEFILGDINELYSPNERGLRMIFVILKEGLFITIFAYILSEKRKIKEWINKQQHG